MKLYFFINGLISLTCIIAVYSMSNAPHRTRFYLCALALAAWCIPWQVFNIFEVTPPNNIVFNSIQPVIQALTKPVVITEAKVLDVQSIWKPELLDILIILSSLGVIWLCRDLFQHFSQLKTLKKYAKGKRSVVSGKRSIDIYASQKIQGALSYGVFRPVIFISDNLRHSHRNVVLEHELTHVEQYDPVWLLLIHSVSRIFLWNPIVWFTARRAKELLELSCDDKCKYKLGEKHYQTTLAELALKVKGAQILPMVSHFIFEGKNFDIKRIKLLNMELSMTFKNKTFLFVAILLLSSIAVLPIYSGQGDSTSHATKARENIISPLGDGSFRVKVDNMPYRSLGILLIDAFNASAVKIESSLLNKFYSIDLEKVNLSQLITTINNKGEVRIFNEGEYYLIANANTSSADEVDSDNLISIERQTRTKLTILDGEKVVFDNVLYHTNQHWTGLHINGYELQFLSTHAMPHVSYKFRILDEDGRGSVKSPEIRTLMKKEAAIELSVKDKKLTIQVTPENMRAVNI